jgi:hypothetical protein
VAKRSIITTHLSHKQTDCDISFCTEHKLIIQIPPE